MFYDSSSNQRGTRLGVVLKSPQGDTIVQSISCDLKAINNEAEYEALIAGMTVALDLKETSLNVYSDSLLIVSQLNEEFATKDSKMMAYLETTKNKAKQFNPFQSSRFMAKMPRWRRATRNLAGTSRRRVRQPFLRTVVQHRHIKRTKRSSLSKYGSTTTYHSAKLQQERQRKSIQNWRLGVKESLPKHQRSKRRQAGPGMGRTISDPRCRRKSQGHQDARFGIIHDKKLVAIGRDTTGGQSRPKIAMAKKYLINDVQFSQLKEDIRYSGHFPCTSNQVSIA
uniref:RNase H type-1 domain-containing protein n=1 Tax=Chenopodium quinoa TaxID=63459 RepID=A0A803MBL3_CHEQI